jgi:hypothetical protein
MNWCVYFYVDTCAYCERILPEIVDFFSTRAIPFRPFVPTAIRR